TKYDRFHLNLHTFPTRRSSDLHASEVHDQSTILERLLNFENHLGLTNEQIVHDDIHSVPLYKESYVLITPKNTFPNNKKVSIKRSEEHTSELQSRFDIVCRLLL